MTHLAFSRCLHRGITVKASVGVVISIVLTCLWTALPVQAHDRVPVVAKKLTVKPVLSANAIAADIKRSALWDGRKLLDFQAIDTPPMVKAQKADFLQDNEYVLGLTVNGQSRAYPTRFAAWHHIINDKIKGKDGSEAFVTVTY